MSKGIVVDHKESGVRYAISEHNFDDKTEVKVRDLKPGETILGYVPKAVPTRDTAEELSGLSELESGTPASTPKNPTEATPSGVAKNSNK